MKVVVALVVLLSSCGTSSATTNVNLLRFDNRKIVVAQSYCEMCSNARTSCQLGCNGAGKCIQACDDQYRECRLQNCRR